MRSASSPSDRVSIQAAFLAIRERWSPDRVVCDPQLNSSFRAECERLGITLSQEECNRILLNLRRAGKLRRLSSRETRFPTQADYQFASEIAIRMIERRDGVTLDDVICNPTRAAEFDRLCAQIAPGYSPLQYRWAALSLRKNKGLRPELVGRVVKLDSVIRANIRQLVIDDLPSAQAIYLLICSTRLLYIGETTDIRVRLRKHLDHSDNREFARWKWQNEGEPLFVEYHILPKTTSTRTRKAIELELIRSRNPEFNVKR